MTPIPATTFRAGMRRGVVEFGQSLRTPTDAMFYIIGAIVLVVVLWVFRDEMIGGTDLRLTQFFFPGILAMQVMVAGAYGAATVLSTEREDGTLLRAKSLPHGMAGYVVGISTRTLLDIAFSLGMVLVPALFLISGLGDRGWAALAAIPVLLLGVLAVLPLGLAIGAIFRNPRSVGGLGLLIVGGLVVVSGIFSPLVAMPLWAQIIAQILPLYWLGLALRATLLPEGMQVLEIGESWRMLESLGVLGAWAILGLVLAPVLLRRMARRESGSAMERRRQAALHRV